MIMSETLIFIGGEGPDRLDLPVENHFSRIIASDSGLDLALRLGFRPDLVVGDMDSVQADISGYETVVRPCDKDESDFELALGQCCGDYVLIGGGGGRMDHLINIYSCFSRLRPPRMWITSSDIIFFSMAFRASLVEGTLVSFYPYDLKGSAVVTARGLVWELDGRVIDLGFFSLSNRSRGEVTEIMSSYPLAIRFGMDKSFLKAKIYVC